jgi:hypothetical protein
MNRKNHMEPVLIFGHRPKALADIAKADPEKAKAISACAALANNEGVRMRHTEMVHAACKAIGKKYPIGQTEAARAERKQIIVAYDAAFASRRGIVDEDASREAQTIAAKLDAAGWDASLLGPGGI